MAAEHGEAPGTSAGDLQSPRGAPTVLGAADVPVPPDQAGIRQGTGAVVEEVQLSLPGSPSGVADLFGTGTANVEGEEELTRSPPSLSTASATRTEFVSRLNELHAHLDQKIGQADAYSMTALQTAGAVAVRVDAMAAESQ